jgi:hypothetical protein
MAIISKRQALSAAQKLRGSKLGRSYSLKEDDKISTD